MQAMQKNADKAPYFSALIRVFRVVRVVRVPHLFIEPTSLTRIIHEASTAAADPGMATALRSVGFLDVLSNTPVESSRRAPCIHARLRRLATNHHE